MRAALAALLSALVLAGCAARTVTAVPAPRSTAAAPAAKPAEVSYGTILVERPVPVAPGDRGTAAASGGAGVGNVRATILAAIGRAGTGEQRERGRAGAAEGDGSATEFIIRSDDGRMISVVQSGAFKFQPGERVMIIHGEETRLAPGAQG